LKPKVKGGTGLRVNPYDQKVNIFNSTGHEKDVRNHLLVSSCAYITGKQASKLEISVSPIEGYEDKAVQQLDDWQKFLDSQESELFEQMWSYAWAYNVCFADPEICTYGRYTIKEFTVIPQTSVNPTLSGFSYFGQNIDEDRVLELRFRSDSEMSLANQLWPYVSALQSLQRADTLAGVVNSVGEKNLRWKPNNTAKNYSQKEFDKAQQYAESAGEAEYSITVLPDWEIQVTQPPPEPDFDGKIRRNRQEILTSFQMNWLDASSWTSGTYGSLKAQMETYNDFIYSIRKSWCRSLESMARRQARWNLEPLYVKFDCERPTLDESTLDRMNAITTLKNLNLSPAEQAILYPEVGLPVPEAKAKATQTINPIIAEAFKSPLVANGFIQKGGITTEEIRVNIGMPHTPAGQVTQQNPQLQSASLDMLNTKYKGSLSGFLMNYGKALQNQPYKFDFTGYETIATPLKVDLELAKLVWSKYQEQFRESIKDMKRKQCSAEVATLEFNRIWGELVKEVQSWV